MSAVDTFAHALAWPLGSGVAGGAIATAVLGVPAYIHTHLKLGRHHRERLAQTERHHAERAAQATAQHNEDKHQAERHHQRLLDQVAASAPAMPPPAPPRVKGGQL